MQKQSQSATSLDEVVVHLLHRVSQRADDIFGKEVSDADLTPRQFAVLLAAAEIEIRPRQTLSWLPALIDRRLQRLSGGW